MINSNEYNLYKFHTLYPETKVVLEKYLEIASKHFNRVFAFPNVAFNVTGKTAGYAIFSKWLIRLNTDLFKQNREDFLNSTCPHELAHLITREIYGTRADSVNPHGPEWKSVMRVFGLEPKRCHSYDVSLTKRQSFKIQYSCACGIDHGITLKAHNKITQGLVRYSCKKCKQVITKKN